MHDTGAFIPYGIAIARWHPLQSPGLIAYQIHVQFQAVYTPTVTVTPTGGGRPQACFAINECGPIGHDLGIDRFEIRRKNLISDDQFPYPREGLIFADDYRYHDSGQYFKALDLIEEKSVPGIFQMQQEARSQGKYLGLGLAYYVEGTGLGPYEGGHIKIHPITGKVYVNTGLSGQGQGHDTVFAQIVADQLGVKVEDVILTEGDSGAYDWGVATFASRAAVVS